MNQGATLAVACIASAALAIAAVLLLPKAMGARKPSRIVTVDLSGIVAAQQKDSIQTLMAGESDEAKRKAAIARAETFGKRIDQEIRALAAECGCVVLMREAVVAGEVDDLTAALTERLRVGQ